MTTDTERRCPALEARDRVTAWRRNEAALAACPRPHDLEPTEDRLPHTDRPRVFRCRKCGGTLHWDLAQQYLEGLRDARAEGAASHA